MQGANLLITHYEIEGENIQRVSVVDVRNMDDETFYISSKGIVDAGVKSNNKLNRSKKTQV